MGNSSTHQSPRTHCSRGQSQVQSSCVAQLYMVDCCSALGGRYRGGGADTEAVLTDTFPSPLLPPELRGGSRVFRTSFANLSRIGRASRMVTCSYLADWMTRIIITIGSNHPGTDLACGSLAPLSLAAQLWLTTFGAFQAPKQWNYIKHVCAPFFLISQVMRSCAIERETPVLGLGLQMPNTQHAAFA